MECDQNPLTSYMSCIDSEWLHPWRSCLRQETRTCTKARLTLKSFPWAADWLRLPGPKEAYWISRRCSWAWTPLCPCSLTDDLPGCTYPSVSLEGPEERKEGIPAASSEHRKAKLSPWTSYKHGAGELRIVRNLGSKRSAQLREKQACQWGWAGRWGPAPPTTMAGGITSFMVRHWNH